MLGLKLNHVSKRGPSCQDIFKASFTCMAELSVWWIYLCKLFVCAHYQSNLENSLFSENLLLGQPGTSSSVHKWSYGPGLPVDVNKDPYWSHGHCTATDAQAYPWISVDMGKRYQIIRATVSNSHNLRKWLIQLSNLTPIICHVHFYRLSFPYFEDWKIRRPFWESNGDLRWYCFFSGINKYFSATNSPIIV